MLLDFAEVTDQNFVDEDIGGRKGSNMCSAKKAKTLGTGSSDNDQVNFNSIPVAKDWTPQLTYILPGLQGCSVQQTCHSRRRR